MAAPAGEEDAELQTYVHSKLHPRILYGKLIDIKRKSKLPLFVYCSVELENEGTKDLRCVLVCSGCNAKLKPSNPSQTSAQHFVNAGCKKRPVPVADCVESSAANHSPPTAGGASTSSAKRQKYGATAEQCDQIATDITKFIISSNSAFSVVENPYLKAAFSRVGVALPSRRAVGGLLLDKLHAEVEVNVRSKLKADDTQCWASDGWRKAACQDGTPLANYMVLRPDGGAVQYKVSVGLHGGKSWGCMAANHGAAWRRPTRTQSPTPLVTAGAGRGWRH